MIIPPKIPFQKSLTRNNLSFFFVLVKYLFRFTKLFTKYKYLKKRLIYVILFLKKRLIKFFLYQKVYLTLKVILFYTCKSILNLCLHQFPLLKLHFNHLLTMFNNFTCRNFTHFFYSTRLSIENYYRIFITIF